MRYPDARGLFEGLSQFGSDAKARLRWLLEFVERDLRSTEAADAAALGALVFAFAARMAKPRPGVPLAMGQLSGEAADPRSVRKARSTIGRAQREVREALQSFAVDDRCTLPFKIVGWERLSDGRVVPVVGGDWWSRFYGAVFMLAVELGSALGSCANPSCRKLFLRSKRQVYCGARCSQRLRTQRFREAHPERVSDLRHASHARKQRKRLGPRVKVERRSRLKRNERPQ
jgi:hypothetical protein